MPAPASENRPWSIVLWLATSLGIPGVLLQIYQGKLLDHPWFTLALALIWSVVVLIGGILAGVWKNVQKFAEERISIFLALDRRLTRYRRKYLDWVFYQHRDFDVKGLSIQGIYNLELEQVFVDLAIKPKAAHEISRSILSLPEDIGKRHQIWEYIKDDEREDNFVLIGPPGSGKTTLLKKVALLMTNKRRTGIRQNMPVLLFLREHAEAIEKNPAFKLNQAILDALSRREGPLPPEGWFEAQLREGKCLVLLDGLDEVASPETRKAVVQWVETQMKGHPKSRFLVTSRPHGYRYNPISGVTVLEVQPFTRSQVRQFVANWYRANEIMAYRKVDPGVEMKAREGAAELLRRLEKSQTLTDLAVNPLLLTMIATIHRYKSSLPGRRVELYAEICEVFLGKRQQARGLDAALTPAQKQVVLQPLAYHLMKVKRREVGKAEAVGVIRDSLLQVSGVGDVQAGEAFLGEIEDRSGILQQRESGVYSFAHLAFQEYLASVHVKEQGIVTELVEMIGSSWWHEVIRLYGAQGDVSPIMEKCLAQEKPTVGDLSLAIDCIEEAQKVDIVWRERVNDLVSMGLEDLDVERFKLAAETLLARRIQNMISVEDGLFMDISFVSNAEYQIFLDVFSSHHPDHWLGSRFSHGEAANPLVGLRQLDAEAFCSWLSSRYDTFRFRVPRPGELSKWGVDQASPCEGGIKGYWVKREEGAGHLERCGSLSSELTRVDEFYVQNRVFEDFRMHVDIEAEISKVERENLGKDKNERRSFEIEVDEDVRRAVNLFAQSNSSSNRLGLFLSLDRDLEIAIRLANPLPSPFVDFDGFSSARVQLEDPLLQGPALSYERALARNRNLGRDRVRDFAHSLDMDDAIDLGFVLDRLRQRALDRRLDIKDKYYLGWATRMIALSLFVFASRAEGMSIMNSRKAISLGLKEYVDNLRIHCEFCYRYFFILQARMDGELPAVEGLRFVKEHRGLFAETELLSAKSRTAKKMFPKRTKRARGYKTGKGLVG